MSSGLLLSKQYQTYFFIVFLFSSIILPILQSWLAFQQTSQTVHIYIKI